MVLACLPARNVATAQSSHRRKQIPTWDSITSHLRSRLKGRKTLVTSPSQSIRARMFQRARAAAGVNDGRGRMPLRCCVLDFSNRESDMHYMTHA